MKRAGPPDIPAAINVLTMGKQADKELKGILRSYERLSEVAHPNYLGSAAVFRKPDHSTLIWHFGKRLRDHSGNVSRGLNSLNAALEIFEYAYERIGELTATLRNR